MESQELKRSGIFLGSDAVSAADAIASKADDYGEHLRIAFIVEVINALQDIMVDMKRGYVEE